MTIQRIAFAAASALLLQPAFGQAGVGEQSGVYRIGGDGQPRDIRVVRSLGLGLEKNAIPAVGKWRFAAATKGDQPGASQPTLLRGQLSPPIGSRENASARLSFDIDSQGVPTNIHVDESTDSLWNDEVMALISEWRFQAALNNGTAVQSRGFIDLTRGLPSAPSPQQIPAPKNRQ